MSLKAARLLVGVALVACQVVHSQTGNTSQTDCSKLNHTYGPYPYGPAGNALEHYSGGHGWTNQMTGTCSYTGMAQYGATTPCHPHSTSNSQSYPYENGSTKYYHYQSSQDAQGSADCANGGNCKTDAEGAAAVTACQSSGCGVASIGINGSGNGAGFGVTYTAPNGSHLDFTDKNHYANDCTGYTLNALQGPPAPTCTTPNPPYPPSYGNCGNGSNWTWDVNSCSWVCASGASPIAIDTKGNRWQKEELFTDPVKGDYVSFDIQGNGIIQKMSWPKWGSGVGWLALDSDGDGVIKNGQELFGNFTPHSNGGVLNHPDPNGFLALAWWDRPEQGGNGDLLITKLDAVWPKLKLWVPGKHCYQNKDVACHSLPDELHGLDEYGLTSISLVYTGPEWTDGVGNDYRFQTVLVPLAETERGNGDNHQISRDKLGRTVSVIFWPS